MGTPAKGGNLKKTHESTIFVKCYKHPERDAVRTCTVCGNYACKDCGVNYLGQHMCNDCVVRIAKSAAMEASARVNKRTKEKAKRIRRPLSVTFIAVFELVTGLLFLAGAINVYTKLVPSLNEKLLTYLAGGMAGVSETEIALILAAQALVSLLTAAWLWKLDGKGWFLAVVRYGMSLVALAFSAAWSSVVLYGLFLIVLWMNRNAFNKDGAASMIPKKSA